MPARSYPSNDIEKAFAVTCPTGTIPLDASDEFLEAWKDCILFETS